LLAPHWAPKVPAPPILVSNIVCYIVTSLEVSFPLRSSSLFPSRTISPDCGLISKNTLVLLICNVACAPSRRGGVCLAVCSFTSGPPDLGRLPQNSPPIRSWFTHQPPGPSLSPRGACLFPHPNPFFGFIPQPFCMIIFLSSTVFCHPFLEPGCSLRVGKFLSSALPVWTLLLDFPTGWVSFFGNCSFLLAFPAFLAPGPREI